MTTYAAKPTHDTYLTTSHFGSLDGLRFLCIAAVLWHHSPMPAVMPAALFTQGHLGVHLFFMLSGFLITTLLLREEHTTGAFNLPAFYWRRACRILPVYVLVVGVAVFYDIAIKGNSENLALLPYYALFLSNFIPGTDIGFLAPTWSLAVEEQYYLIWPLLLLLTPRRWIVPVVLGLTALTLVAAFGLLGARDLSSSHPVPLTLAQHLPAYTPILLGSLLGLILHHPRGYQAMVAVAGFRYAAPLWLGVLVMTTMVMPRILDGQHTLPLHGLMGLLLAALVLREDNALAPVLSWRPVARIGQISYGIYLYHLFPLSVLFKLFDMAGWDQIGWIFPLNFVLSVVIAEISFRTYEAWFLRWRHMGASRPEPRNLPALEPKTA